MQYAIYEILKIINNEKWMTFWNTLETLRSASQWNIHPEKKAHRFLDKHFGPLGREREGTRKKLNSCRMPPVTLRWEHALLKIITIFFIKCYGFHFIDASMQVTRGELCNQTAESGLDHRTSPWPLFCHSQADGPKTDFFRSSYPFFFPLQMALGDGK